MTLKENAHEQIPPSSLDARFHGPLMTFFLRRTRDRVLAQDLTQETLLRVLASGQLGLLEQPDRYVFTIAQNLLRDRKRLQAKIEPSVFIPIEEVIQSGMEQLLVEGLSPERVLISKDSLAEVLHTLGELGERTRNIFVLFRLERMKQKDIAALFGISQSTVEKHVMRATLHLAVRYGGR